MRYIQIYNELLSLKRRNDHEKFKDLKLDSLVQNTTSKQKDDEPQSIELGTSKIFNIHVYEELNVTLM